MEQAYRSALRAYELLGKPDALGIMHSPGYHGANDVQAAMNWLDYQFGRSRTKWTNEFVYPWDYDKWKAQVKETVDVSKYPPQTHRTLIASRSPSHRADWEKKAADIRKSVEWMLGDKTPGTLANPFPLPKLGDPSQPAAPPRGGRGGAAQPRPTSTLFDDIHGTKASGNSYGWINTAVQQTTNARSLSQPVRFRRHRSRSLYTQQRRRRTRSCRP